MPLFNVTQIATKGVKSLVWDGDQLIDWVGGAARWGLDGSVRERSLMIAYRFDSVVASPDSRWVLVYERLGTKGILLKDGRLHREIDRSYYWAHAYDFPAQLIAGANGTTLLVHCPRRYNQLEVEGLFPLAADGQSELYAHRERWMDLALHSGRRLVRHCESARRCTRAKLGDRFRGAVLSTRKSVDQ